MDPNANATDNGSDVSAPAPATTSPETATETTQTPAETANSVAESTENTSAPGADGSFSLDEGTQKYLQGQGIKATDPQAIISELVERNKGFRKENNKTEGSESDAKSVSEALAPATQSQEPPKLSDFEIASISDMMERRYNDVKVDAKFYSEMREAGWNPVKSDGHIDIDNVNRYAEYRQKLADAEKIIQQKPSQVVPENKVEKLADMSPVQEMTKTAAENIVMASNKAMRYGQPVHPQYEEAQKFLQDHAFDK